MLCTELKSMTVPDSLQTLGYYVFFFCSRLVPSTINVGEEQEYDSDLGRDTVEHDFTHISVPSNPSESLLKSRWSSCT